MKMTNSAICPQTSSKQKFTTPFMRLLTYLLLIPVLVACGEAEQQGTDNQQVQTHEQPGIEAYADLDVQEAKLWIGSTPDKVILDVRTPEETAGGMITDAIHIDFYAADFQEQLNELDKNKPILVYCASGGRSGQTLEIMKSLGFKEAHNLLGGYTSWYSSE